MGSWAKRAGWALALCIPPPKERCAGAAAFLPCLVLPIFRGGRGQVTLPTRLPLSDLPAVLHGEEPPGDLRAGSAQPGCSAPAGSGAASHRGPPALLGRRLRRRHLAAKSLKKKSTGFSLVGACKGQGSPVAEQRSCAGECFDLAWELFRRNAFRGLCVPGCGILEPRRSVPISLFSDRSSVA